MFPLERGTAEDPASDAPSLGTSHDRHSLPASNAPSSAGNALRTKEGGDGDEKEGRDLHAENEQLRQQLNQAVETAKKWQSLHSQLHSFCLDQLMPAASAPS